MMGAPKNAIAILLLGLGVLALVVGLVTDAYSAALGFVGMIALWVAGITWRAFWFNRDPDEEFGSYRPRGLYDRY
jgi:type IV secretory pathway TrbD component